MQTECTPKLFEFEAVERRSVVAGFDGGNITSNAGALLLGQVDRGLGLVRRFADCFIDRRDPRYVEHQVETLVGQRIFGLALGYEDLNDHDELRKDPTFAVLAGKLSPVLRTDCEPLAGKSTLNRLEHTPRRHASKYHKIDCDDAQVDALLVDLFLEAHERAPREIVGVRGLRRQRRGRAEARVAGAQARSGAARRADRRRRPRGSASSRRLSTLAYPPFMLARLCSTLDHIAGGRFGWNIVTIGRGHRGAELRHRQAAAARAALRHGRRVRRSGLQAVRLVGPRRGGDGPRDAAPMPTTARSGRSISRASTSSAAAR